ncbi:MAG: hypothetical protein QM647_00285 [Asticcacaulis sp.]|uniref:hypothetical protein n=1 Tax=Asticcacaulis sp. TaxID=1872648 RepID=UPI0039E26CE5
MTQPIDPELQSRLAPWRIEPPADDMSARLITAALQLPQAQPWHVMALGNLQRALTEWQYAIGYKLAALAGCAALGLGIGIATGETLDVAGIALMSGLGG